MKGHEIEIKPTIDKLYPPILRKAAYPASRRNRIELEKHIQEFLKPQVIRKVSENEEVEITTPCFVAWHNDKSSVCGDF